jgi:hypothetical protein
MANGLLKIFNKLTNVPTDFIIVGNFSIEENINEMPNNSKMKIITNGTYREEFEVNSVCYHEDTNSWWIVKADESTYLQNGEYEHEVELVEYFETLSFKHLPNCAFRPNTYSYKRVFERLFDIAKVDVDVVMPDFINPSLTPLKDNKYLSFTNSTLSNAIRTVSRILNAIPKLTRVDGQPTLSFINRLGLESNPEIGLDATFPVAMEVNSNSAEQFTVRSISNIENAKSLELAVIPQIGGFSVSTDDQPLIDTLKSKVYLPTRVDRIEYVAIAPRIRINHWKGGLSYLIYEGLYLDPVYLKSLIVNFNYVNPSVYRSLGSTFINDNLVMPNKDYAYVPLNAPYTNTYDSPLAGLLSLKEKKDWDKLILSEKNKTFYYEQSENQLFIPPDYYNLVPNYVIDTRTVAGVTETIEINFFTANPKNSLFRVACYPIADIKVSYDNQNDGQDEKFFNQSGTAIDLKSTTKVINAHTLESADGIKIRNAKYTSFEDILPVGQRIIDNGIVYIINQKSIDCVISNAQEYYSVVYNLSANRVSRAEEIGVNNEVRTYAVDSSSLIKRTSLYKDYLEFSLDGLEPSSPVAPYLPKSKTVNIDSNFVGADLGYLAFSKILYANPSVELTEHFIHTPVFYDMAKSKIIQVDFVDNNIIGTKLDLVPSTSTYAQSNITYVGAENLNGQIITSGKFKDIELLFLDDQAVRIATNNTIANTSFTASDGLPFTDAPLIDVFYYPYLQAQSMLTIVENNYDKDLYEIPVFEYQVQVNDKYGQNGNVVVSDDFFKVFRNTSGNNRPLQYNYVISNTRFTNENASNIIDNALNLGLNPLNQQRVIIGDFGTPTYKRHQLYSSYNSELSNTPNTVALQNKNIGIFAFYNAGTTLSPIWVKKFIYAFNNYTMESNNTIALYINNWKI